MFRNRHGWQFFWRIFAECEKGKKFKKTLSRSAKKVKTYKSFCGVRRQIDNDTHLFESTRKFRSSAECISNCRLVIARVAQRNPENDNREDLIASGYRPRNDGADEKRQFEMYTIGVCPGYPDL